MGLLAGHDSGIDGDCSGCSRGSYGSYATVDVIPGLGMAPLWRGDSLFLPSSHTTARAGSRLNEQLRTIAELDRVIHEPGRLMIVALLAAVKECDFLYLLGETEMNKGNLSSHLARLEEAGYLQIEKTYRGKVPQTLLRLTRSGRAAFEEYRRGINAALSKELRALWKR